MFCNCKMSLDPGHRKWFIFDILSAVYLFSHNSYILIAKSLLEKWSSNVKLFIGPPQILLECGQTTLECTGEDPSCKLHISPNNCLVDEELRISASGLNPQQKISIVNQVQDKGIGYFSSAYYIADDTGTVDVSRMKAEPGGSYEGLEPMGLFWSKKQEPGELLGKRLMKVDVTTPLVEDVYILDGFKTANDCLRMVKEGNWLCSSSCNRWYMAQGVERITVRKGGLLATLFIPKGDGPFPGILDLFGTIGGITEYRAALFASHGIAAIALQYFKGGSDFASGMTADIEYYENAVDYMLQHPKVMKPCSGVIGNSQGYMEALLLTSLCPNKMKACVAINGDHIVNLLDHKYKGEIFPHKEYYNTEMQEGSFMTEEGFEMYELAMFRLRTESDKNFIPVSYYFRYSAGSIIKPIATGLERSDADIMLLHSGDDRCIPPITGQYVLNYLKKHGKTRNQYVVYPGAGHLLEPPHSPLFRTTYHGTFGCMTVWGGEPTMHARAQEQSWRDILNFFRATLSKANLSTKHTKL